MPGHTQSRRRLVAAVAAIILSAATISLGQTDKSEYRFWISQSGNRYLNARLLGVTKSSVLLRDQQGKDHEISLRELSNEDRQFAMRANKKVEAGFGFKSTSPRDQPRLAKRQTDNPIRQVSHDNVELLPIPEAEAPRPVDDETETTAQKVQPKSIQVPSVLKTLSDLVTPKTAKPNPAEKVEAKAANKKTVFGPESSVYVSLSGKFLNEFVRVPIAEEKQVADVILGTPIMGTARTHGDLTVRLIPSSNSASMELIARGQADSLTTGHQMIIHVHSDGLTQFEARKRLSLDTRGIRLWPATAKANTTVVRQEVSTELPGVLGDIAGRIAHRVVDANRPQIDNEASQKAATRAAQELDQTVHSEALKLQRILRQFAPGMTTGNPAVPVQFRTTTDRLELLVGENQPQQWLNFEKRPPTDNEDIVVVLPKSTVDTAKQLRTAAKLLAISVGSQLPDVNADELEPTAQNWSKDGKWLTLVWNVKKPVVQAISDDFLPPLAPRSQGLHPPVVEQRPLPPQPPIADPNQFARPPAPQPPIIERPVPIRPLIRRPILRRFRP